MKKSSKIALGCVGGTLLSVYLLAGSVSHDIGYHCDFTGSTKSWTQWPLGIRIGFVYEPSPVEEFLAKNQPDKLEHKWVTYEGTGKNILGEPVFFGHGRPNSLFLFPRGYLKLFVEQSPKEDVIEFYETLRRDNRDEIRLRLDKLYDESKRLLEKLAEQATDGDPL
jgi:hypothetical protein